MSGYFFKNPGKHAKYQAIMIRSLEKVAGHLFSSFSPALLQEPNYGLYKRRLSSHSGECTNLEDIQLRRALDQHEPVHSRLICFQAR